MPGYTNTREDGLETLIVRWLTDHNGYEEGSNADYDKRPGTWHVSSDPQAAAN